MLKSLAGAASALAKPAAQAVSGIASSAAKLGGDALGQGLKSLGGDALKGVTEPNVTDPATRSLIRGLDQNFGQGNTHTVVSGDTMWDIAQQNGVGLDELVRANPHIQNPSLIYPGQSIAIPGAGAPETTPAAPATTPAPNATPAAPGATREQQPSLPDGQPLPVERAGDRTPPAAGIAQNQAGQNLAATAESTVDGVRYDCATEVKDAIYDEFGIALGQGDAHLMAGRLADNPNFQEFEVPREELANLPPGAIVVWEPGAYSPVAGHISVALGDGRECGDIIRDQLTTNGDADGGSYRVFYPVSNAGN